MDYRDERDALRARVESLEQQLEEAKRDAQARKAADPARVAQIQAEMSEVEAKIHRIRGELAAIGVASGVPRRSRVGAFLLWGALAALGLSTFMLMSMRSVQRASVAAAVQAPPPATPAQAHTASSAVDYFKDPTSVPGAFQAKIGGPVRVLRLTVYDDYAMADIQDPKNHENVDSYTLMRGSVDNGRPVMLSGNMKTAKDVDAAVQDLAAVDFSLLPKMAEDAKARLHIDGGKVTHAMLDRTLGGEVGWRVYVNSPRKGGYVAYDTAGHLKMVMQ